MPPAPPPAFPRDFHDLHLDPSDNYPLRLATTVLMETDEEWQTEKR